MDAVFDPLRSRLLRLNEIGVALSAEPDPERLLERILESARELTRADGGTLYLRTSDDRLRFAIMQTDSLAVRVGGTQGDTVSPPPIPLYDETGAPNHRMVAAHAALTGRTVNIPDASRASDFDLSGARAFDQETGYHSRSLLTVPLRDHEGEVIGVLQLINAINAITGQVAPFSSADQELAESLASQAAVALRNKRLIEDQRRLFESFVELIATAIDDKSPHTGHHCRRVPELTMMLAEAAAAATGGPLAEFRLSGDERYALRIASWLHDCGKITTPERVIEKSTKLQTIFDRIETVDTRFEVLRREAEIARLRAELEARRAGREPDLEALDRAYRNAVAGLEADRDFLRRANVGGERMTAADQDRVRAIGRRRWVGPGGEEGDLLTADEVRNLTIPKGTLTAEERAIINDHIVATIRMLEALPYPKYLRNVPEYACNHHERMDGTGYPRGLKREEMSVPARVMGIADVFEALTAKERPYKEGMKLSRALAILGQMRLDQHVDPDLFDVFVREKVYLRYAERFLDREQIDPVDESRIPGYTP